MVKWFIALSFTVLALVGCGKSDPRRAKLTEWMQPNERVKVLSTVAMIDDVVGAIGGKYVDHIPLIVGQIDPHSYELVKGDDEKIERADLVFYNGLGLEHGASLFYKLTHHKNSHALGDMIYQKYPERILLEDGAVDPHIWMDFALWAEIIDPIVEALSKKDPDHAEKFAKRGSKIKDWLHKADRICLEKMRAIPADQRYLVTSHDAFNYFTRKYLAEIYDPDWKERFTAPEGLAPDGQMSVHDIKEVSDYLCQHKISVVFPEANLSRDSLNKVIEVCMHRGQAVRISEIPLYGDTIGEPGSGADSYFRMMFHNINTLEKEFHDQ